MDLSLSDLEQAINYWRALRPASGEERTLSPEVDRLATLYALMIYEGMNSCPAQRVDEATRGLIESWRAQQRR